MRAPNRSRVSPKREPKDVDSVFQRRARFVRREVDHGAGVDAPPKLCRIPTRCAQLGCGDAPARLARLLTVLPLTVCTTGRPQLRGEQNRHKSRGLAVLRVLADLFALDPPPNCVILTRNNLGARPVQALPNQ